MSISDFISNENVELIWEIIIDTDMIKSKQNINVSQMRQYFIEKIKMFYDNEKNTYQNLTQMNKSFISLIVKDIQQILEKSSSQQQPLQQQKAPSIVTAQDIQAERKSTFDKNLNQKQEEFMAAMSVHVPEAPKFNDKMDEPIGGNMAELISRTLAQRNFEMDQIHKNTNKSDVENWLKPAETSIKNDTVTHAQPKLQLQMPPQHSQPQQQQQPQQYQYQQPVKYIKIGENLDENVVIKNNIVDLNVSPKQQIGHKNTLKKVLSWDKNSPEFIIQKDNIEMNIHEETLFSDNIFAKLKPLYKPVLETETETDNITLDNLKAEMTTMNNKIDFITEQLSRLLQTSTQQEQQQTSNI
jgi:hypothetical protein